MHTHIFLLHTYSLGQVSLGQWTLYIMEIDRDLNTALQCRVFQKFLLDKISKDIKHQTRLSSSNKTKDDLIAVHFIYY